MPDDNCPVAARETIKPRPQGPEDLGDKAEPKHVEAEKLPPVIGHE
jgi:hypothetical protein